MENLTYLQINPISGENKKDELYKFNIKSLLTQCSEAGNLYI